MPQLIKPSEVKFITKEGECQISLSLDINVNLNADGLAAVSVKQSQAAEEDDKPNWILPDFGGNKVKFGKEVG
jgi:hypothetical protein